MLCCFGALVLLFVLAVLFRFSAVPGCLFCWFWRKWGEVVSEGMYDVSRRLAADQ